MIAGREDVVARNFDQTCQLSEHRAFVVIRVAKAEVNAVSLVIKLWMPSSSLLNKLGDPIHFFLAFGSKTFETIRIVNKTRFCYLSHKVDHLSKDRLG